MRRIRPQLGELHKVRDRGLGLLRLQQRTAQTLKCLDAVRPHRQGRAVLPFGLRKIVRVQRIRALAHGKPEARGGQRSFKTRILRAIPLALQEKAERTAKVGLLHAYIAHADQRVGVLRSVGKNCLEPDLGLFQMLRIESSIGGRVGSRARGVQSSLSALFSSLRRRHLRRGRHVLQRSGKLRVIVMGEVFANGRRAGRILRIPKQRLAQRFTSLRITRMRFQQLAAFGAGLWVVCQNAAERNLRLQVTRILHHDRSKSRNSMSTAILSRRFGLVVRQRGVTRRRIVAVNLAIDRHSLRILALLCQLARILQLLTAIYLGREIFRSRNIWIVRIDRAKTIEIHSRQRRIPAQLGRARQSSKRLCAVWIGKQNLLPGLRRHVHPAAHFKSVRLLQQGLRCRRGSLGRNGSARRDKCPRSQQNR